MKCLVYLCVLVLLTQTKADLPVHCLKSNIEGKWTFYLKPKEKLGFPELYSYTCGHTLPSREDQAFVAMSDKKELESFNDKVTANLESDSTFSLNLDGAHLKGKWTMVYDEGFNLRIEKDHGSFFAFSKYGVNSDKKAMAERGIKSKWLSYCNNTLVGWYNLGDEWGCFYGKKESSEVDKVTNGEVENKQIVVENVVKQADDTEFSFLQAVEKKKNTSEFKDHHKVVEELNKSNLGWKAANYPAFKDLSVAQLNKMAGRKHKGKPHKTIASLFRFKEKSTFKFPENFDWKSKMPPVKNQGPCGSCFALSTLSSLEARLKIKYPSMSDDEVKLSLQHVLDCSVYNQGCDGGYSYLVLKFAHEFELLNNKCYSKNSCESTCSGDDKLPSYKVKDYYYVGGSYGQCSEHSIMKELMEHGPLVLSFEPDYQFMFYKSGVYRSSSKSWLNSHLTKPEWQKVDHSVVVAGWGVDKFKDSEGNTHKQKYWLLQNSWGDSWGEDGYFKMSRGSDHLGIESICEAGKIEVVKK